MSVIFRTRHTLAGLLLALFTLAHQAEASTPEELENARRLFGDGSSLYLEKKYDEALSLLTSSYRLVPSPNSGLLVARCLRDMQRYAEAAEMYDTVAHDAKEKIAGGEAKYQKTLEAADSEGKFVRARVGILRVHLPTPKPGDRLEIDGSIVPIPSDGLVVRYRAPGKARVIYHPLPGTLQNQAAQLAADATIEMTFGEESSLSGSERVASPPVTSEGAPQRSAVPQSRHGAARTGAWVSIAVTAIGAGSFATNGVIARSIYNDLDRHCGPNHCGPEERGRANTGRTHQVLANISLGIGVAGAIAAVGFIAGGAFEAPTKATSLRPLIGPGTVGVGGQF